ncbi:GGDEF domain-containing protein [Actinoplanes couchii]|uniref:GGDEF domain-containing protein n=1 Tax=Actinoplanes couchii TaxID=403638 RepID=A0ABQ3XSB6_9ACTN|nr:diguanylate cyclase [Actinoplanes couchii]MDR6317944.1 diguanylate cyclase (GGDEF)-like protein [Actinoplanes couchii]GID61353.1 hypothetical protein Aco03nite_097570 [Actinoplanes couchii]
MNDARAPRASAALVATAERRVALLSSATVPIYTVGAWLLTGPFRWWMALTAILLTVTGIALRRTPGDLERWASIVMCAVVNVVWGWLTPEIPLLSTAAMMTAIIYGTMMLPARQSRGMIVLLPLTALAGQMAAGVQGRLALQSVGVALTSIMLGFVLYRIRQAFGQRIDDDTRALAEANTRLENQSRTDGLTGLANRRRLDEKLDDAPGGVIMVDVDHFKSYNDHYGHLGGDDCLRSVAGAIAGAIGDRDVAARYGGEEFSVIVAGDDTVEVAERIRRAVWDLAEEHTAAPDGRVTVSVGLAVSRPGENRSGRELLGSADLSLYRAKRDGRNRVGPLVTDRLAA